jgi:uncharacterized membrane protein
MKKLNLKRLKNTRDELNQLSRLNANEQLSANNAARLFLFLLVYLLARLSSALLCIIIIIMPLFSINFHKLPTHQINNKRQIDAK